VLFPKQDVVVRFGGKTLPPNPNPKSFPLELLSIGAFIPLRVVSSMVIKMKLRRIALGIAALTVMVLLVSTASACEPGLSPGYWKHNVKVYNGGPGHYSGDPKESDTSMEGYAAIILGTSDHAQIVAYLDWVNDMFQDSAHNDMWLELANLFNAAAGRLPYSD
jgi:hypothetical protein